MLQTDDAMIIRTTCCRQWSESLSSSCRQQLCLQ